MRRNAALWVVGIIPFAVALLYLSQWLKMPLYSDEVAFRLLRSRYLADGAISFGIYPCASNAQLIPVIFRPVAYLLSVANSATGWSTVRSAPLMGVLLMMAATLGIILRQAAFGSALLLMSGLIGVAGSGLILSRGEAPMLFLGAACLVGFAITVARGVSPLVCGLYLVIVTPIALLAFFVHVQAAILAPLLLLTALAFTLRTGNRVVGVLAVLTAVLVLVGAWAALNSKVRCPEYPALEFASAKSELPGTRAPRRRRRLENIFAGEGAAI